MQTRRWVKVAKVVCIQGLTLKYVLAFPENILGQAGHVGIVITPDVLAEAGYLIAGFPLGETFPKGWEIYIIERHFGQYEVTHLITPSSKAQKNHE